MDVVFYIYTIIILLVCVLAGTSSLSAYLVSHRRIFVFALAAFLFYFIDLSLIFQDEYLVQNLTFDASNFYLIEHPFLKMFLSLGCLEAFWLVILSFLRVKRRALIIIPPVVYLVLCCLVVFLIPAGKINQFCFYTTRQLFLWGMIVFIAVHYHRLKGNDFERLRLRRHLLIYCIITAFSICIVLEDMFNILLLNPTAIAYSLWLYVSERNISENVLIVCCAVWAFRAASQTLSLRFEKPPVGEEQTMQGYIDDALSHYCKRHGLTSREGEILRLVLLGKDNQNIATDLSLALGTVKTHVHNILHKTGKPTRVELIRDFWQG